MKHSTIDQHSSAESRREKIQAAICALSFIFLVGFFFAGTLSSCALDVNSATNSSESSEATVTLSLGSYSSARAVFPEFDTDHSTYKLTLKGKLNGGEEKEIFANKLFSEVEPFTLKTGNWEFTLLSEDHGCRYVSLLTKEIVAGDNQIVFNLSPDFEYGVGSIQLDYTLIDEAGKLDWVKVFLGDTEVESSLSSSVVSVNITNLPAGEYELKVQYHLKDEPTLNHYANIGDNKWRVVGGLVTRASVSLQVSTTPSGSVVCSVTYSNPDWQSDLTTSSTDEVLGFTLDTSMFDQADLAYVQDLITAGDYSALIEYAEELEVLGETDFAAYVREQAAAIQPPSDYSGYVVPDTYQSTNTTGPISVLKLTQTKLTWDGVEYTITDGAQWSSFSSTGLPNQFTYLITSGDKNYLCCVMYYVNNNKDYVKFYAPKETTLTAVPTSSDYSLVGSLSKALTQKSAIDWEVTFTNPTTSGTVTAKRTRSNGEETFTFTAGGKTYDVKFNTWVKNMDLSMPSGDDRMEMHVDEAVWWSTSKYSPNILAKDSVQDDNGYTKPGYALEYGYPFPTGPAFYELQCCESDGMYLLSVTSATLDWDDDVEDYCFSYQVVENITLTKSEYDSLMVHFR